MKENVILDNLEFSYNSKENTDLKDNLHIEELTNSVIKYRLVGRNQNKDLKYLFLYNYETNQYEFNIDCKTDLANERFRLSPEGQQKLEYRIISLKREVNAIDYLENIIEKANKELQKSSFSIPLKSGINYFIKYFLFLIGFCFLIYFFFFILILCLFNPIFIVLEIIILNHYVNFFLKAQKGIEKDIQRNKLLSLIKEESGLYAHQGRVLEWIYGRDGNWMEIRYKKQIHKQRTKPKPKKKL